MRLYSWHYIQVFVVRSDTDMMISLTDPFPFQGGQGKSSHQCEVNGDAIPWIVTQRLRLRDRQESGCEQRDHQHQPATPKTSPSTPLIQPLPNRRNADGAFSSGPDSVPPNAARACQLAGDSGVATRRRTGRALVPWAEAHG